MLTESVDTQRFPAHTRDGTDGGPAIQSRCAACHPTPPAPTPPRPAGKPADTAKSAGRTQKRRIADRLGRMAHSPEARRVRRELDQQLAATAAATGRDLVWTPQDRVVLALIAPGIDRKCDLQRDYSAAVDSKTRIKLSAELRLVEASIERFLRRVHTDMPAPMSRRSQKAQAAARIRWSRDAG